MIKGEMYMNQHAGMCICDEQGLLNLRWNYYTVEGRGEERL